MSPVRLETIVRYCDRRLHQKGLEDWPGAVNGLQVENRGVIRRVAAAVDASLATIRLAAKAGADLLIVHHGLFWSQRQPWTGTTHQLLRALLEHDIAVYSAHLPLDIHPKLGNNPLLCAALGWTRPRPFFRQRGAWLGCRVVTRINRTALASRLEDAVESPVRSIPAGPAVCRHVGIITGGAGAELKDVATEGIDTFITGEGPHWTYALAEELGVNVLYAGHYATETFGVKALGAELSHKFNLPWVFLHHPTGL